MSYQIHDIQQGSAEWHEWRKTGIGASEAPIIEGVSPWSTPLQIKKKKKGIRPEVVVSAAMQKGIDLEPIARAKYEDHTGRLVNPMCISDGIHLASLDGFDLDGEIPAEIKCPGFDAHSCAVLGDVPEYYMPQIQHQLMVSGCDVAHYWSFYEGEGVLVEVKRDEGYIAALREKEIEFWKLIESGTPPDPSEKDILPIDSAEWVSAVESWKTAKTALDEAKKAEDEAKRTLTALAGDMSVQGMGVRVTRYYRKGNINYKAVPELKAVDLEPYRKKGSYNYRVTELKEDN